MPRTIETTVFQFDELNDRAKEKARQWYREASAGDNYYSAFVIDDAIKIAALMGIEIKTRAQRWVNVSTKKEGTKIEPCIYWSGFWSQGDGASFEASYSHKEGAAKAVKEYAPQDAELRRIADSLEEVQRRYGGAINASVSQSGRYNHEMTMRFDFELDDAEGREISEEDEETLKEAFRDFARWIYRQLEKEYEYQNSDEQVDETIRANEYEFEADGSRA